MLRIKGLSLTCMINDSELITEKLGQCEFEECLLMILTPCMHISSVSFLKLRILLSCTQRFFNKKQKDIVKHRVN